jgi:hypothetical protein
MMMMMKSGKGNGTKELWKEEDVGEEGKSPEGQKRSICTRTATPVSAQNCQKPTHNITVN